VLLARGLLVVGLVLLWLYGVFSVLGADASRVRNLRKASWLGVVLFLPVLGSVLWLLTGRPHAATRPTPGTPGVPPEYDRPGRARASNPDDDAEFLEQVRRRAEEQRRKARERQDGTGEDDTPSS
jgi:hypothetical protein